MFVCGWVSSWLLAGFVAVSGQSEAEARRARPRVGPRSRGGVEWSEVWVTDNESRAKRGVGSCSRGGAEWSEVWVTDNKNRAKQGVGPRSRRGAEWSEVWVTDNESVKDSL